MPDVHITIDGLAGEVPAGSTVLEAAQRLGVDIPTLCHHPAIAPIGSCRVCLVQVEKQRVLQPACTFPVSEGMVVHSRSEQVVDARRFVLQLLFSERNHFCMFCQMSGSCELQSLAYEYGLDHWEFDRAYPHYEVDASRKYFVHEPNRCILCRRCIRVCEQLVGNSTLGLKARGVKTEVIADLDVPFGESSCVSCGTCLQVCPTGALDDRSSAFMGATAEITRVKSRCVACGVGCGVELVVRDGRVIRVEGDWGAEPNHGLLCEIGRFALLNEARERLRTPLVRTEAGLREASWEEATALIALKLGEAGADVTTLIAGTASTEAGAAIVRSFPGDQAVIGEASAPVASDPIALLDDADCFVVVGVDLTRDLQVAGFAIKRGVRNRQVPLLLVADGPNGLEPWAAIQTTAERLDDVIKTAGAALRPVIVADAASSATAEALRKALPKARLLCLAHGGNAVGLASTGLRAPAQGKRTTAYYVLAGEIAPVGADLMLALREAPFVAVQASFRQPWDAVADVILPSPVMFEKTGSLANAEGRMLQLVAAVPYAAPSEVRVIEEIAAGLRSAQG